MIALLAVRAVPRFAWRAWCTPPPLGRRTAARDAEAVDGLAPIPGMDGFQVGEGPLVLAVHGWGGRAAQWAPLARRLARAGYRVVVPHLPGAAGGEPTDVKQVAAAVDRVIDAVGAPEIVVAHSFANVTLRLTTVAPGATVLLAPIHRMPDAVEVFSTRLRLFPWTKASLLRRLERWDPELSPLITRLMPHQHAGARVLLIHDPADPDTPFAASVEYSANRPDVIVETPEDLGHAGILDDPNVMERIAAFVVAPVPAPASSGGLEPA